MLINTAPEPNLPEKWYAWYPVPIAGSLNLGSGNYELYANKQYVYRRYMSGSGCAGDGGGSGAGWYNYFLTEKDAINWLLPRIKYQYEKFKEQYPNGIQCRQILLRGNNLLSRVIRKILGINNI